ncbi:transcriptional regulator [Vibrio galatheae]|uniref:Transcriptional regulator n=1 Tax=Vibrio galatheae TaxID=579748 RepID=A0A0F4NIE3_9VIBR|nr:hypothetical protein [Vibrio galatheae]KJY81836.1 transcriptional regulator [Vibrio galatheae]
MNQLDSWVKQIEIWYQTRKHDQGRTLETLILSPPDPIWGPYITPQQSKAIACWLDGCLRLFECARFNEPDIAYPYLQLAYGKLQLVVTNPSSELTLRDWCMKRMQHLAVLSLEFCNQQSQVVWQSEAHRLIENHVQFMTDYAWNEPLAERSNTLH